MSAVAGRAVRRGSGVRQCLEVGAVLGSVFRIIARPRLHAPQRRERDDVRTDPCQRALVVRERSPIPWRRALPERDEDVSLVVPNEVGQFETNAVALVPGSPVLVLGWRVSPAVRLKESCDPFEVFEPDRDVDVVVRPRHRSLRRSRPPTRRTASSRSSAPRGDSRRARAPPAAGTPDPPRRSDPVLGDPANGRHRQTTSSVAFATTRLPRVEDTTEPTDRCYRRTPRWK